MKVKIKKYLKINFEVFVYEELFIFVYVDYEVMISEDGIYLFICVCV